MNNKIAEIKEALKSSTPCPWSLNDTDTAYSNAVFVNPTGTTYIEIATGMTIEDATFIANAPTYISYLLDELEKSHEENQRLADWANDKIYNLETEQTAYAEEMAAFREAILNISKEHTTMKEALETTRAQIRATYFRAEAYASWSFYHTVDDVLRNLDRGGTTK